MPTLIVATVFLLVMQGAKHFMDLRQDEQEANKMMSRELKIVELNILSELEEAELLMDGMEMRMGYHLDATYKLYHDTYNTMLESDFILATAVAFEPYYYPKEGRWFEPRCIRRNGKLISEQIGGPDHDYFNMDWYKLGLTNTRRPVKWTDPYADPSQENELLISLTRPLKVVIERDQSDAGIGSDEREQVRTDSMGAAEHAKKDPRTEFAEREQAQAKAKVKKEKVVGVLCIDVSLTSLKKVLEDAKPYKGSVCQLLDDKGTLLVSSDSIVMDSTDYFIGVKNVQGHGLQVRLACPKSEIYGLSRMQNTLTLILMLAGLMALAYIIQRSIYNTLLLNHAKKKQSDMKYEMRIAHNIQMNILRYDFPDNLSAALLPMQEVGGDLYDFYQRDDTLYFIIGDVSGKGISAAMMMSSAVNLFRMTAQHYNTPEEIVSQINGVLSERNPSLMFVTAFVGKLDMRHGLLTYCNAGHNPPIVNGLPIDTDPDIPIGYDKDYKFRQRGILFPEGSYIVLYTDGITEIRNAERKCMGLKRLVSIVQNYHAKSTQDLLNYIALQTLHFASRDDDDFDIQTDEEINENGGRHDDMTLLCITNPMPMQTPTLRISNETEEITRLKSLLREYCECLGCGRRLTRKILLAVEEAVANVINYAYPKGELGNIEIDILSMPPTEAQEGDITIIITDNGKPFNPLTHGDIDVEQAIDNRQIGGLGIHLYQQLMDSVIYDRKEDKNILTLSKNITINES